MALKAQELISPELEAAARRIFGSAAQPIPVYFQEAPAEVFIGGGAIGPQIIQTLSVSATIKPWMMAALLRLDRLLDLDFITTPSRNTSKVRVYLDTVINLDGGGTTLGIALNNEMWGGSWWEIILNGPPLLNDEAYFKFAFVHELGHALGLEHPFDASDGDLGGQRFGDPDASVTVMSYTEPSGGWPDFYMPSDLAVLVRLWGLERDHADWLIEAGNGQLLLLDRDAAEKRLALMLPGDVLQGPAPAPPAAVEPHLSHKPGELLLAGLVEKGRWESSWDGGSTWVEGSGSSLVVESGQLKQLMLRQQDRWGRFSPERTVVASNQRVQELSPELLLPPSAVGHTGLQPLLAGPTGDPVLLWSLDAALAEQADSIRAAVAELDALVELDFLELPASGSQALVQLHFQAAKHEDAPLISLNRTRQQRALNDGVLLLEDHLNVTLQAAARRRSHTTLHLAVLQALGHAVGLQAAPGLFPDTTVMAPLQPPLTLRGDGGLSALDRAALRQQLGPETRGNEALLHLNTSPALISVGRLAASFREDSTGRSITTLDLLVHRSGNVDVRVPLIWTAGNAQDWLVLQPGETEARLQLELISGQAVELPLELSLPRHALAAEGTNTTSVINLRTLEFALTSEELIDQLWQASLSAWSHSGLIGWHLTGELEGSWGAHLRAWMEAIETASGLHLVELPADHPLLTWSFVPKGSQTEGAISVFELGQDPKAKAEGSEVSEGQALLQAVLLQLGLERPDDPADGDHYQRTPVYPENSALFTALSAGNSGEASLRPADLEALRAVHNVGIRPELNSDDAPAFALSLNKTHSGQLLRREGSVRQLGVTVERRGGLNVDNRLLLQEPRLKLAELIHFAPGQERAEVVLPWPSVAMGGHLAFELEVLSGNHQAVASQLNLRSSEAELKVLGQKLLADPLTGWLPDLDGDWRFTPQFEGQLLLRRSLGTFPGDALMEGLPWSAGANRTPQNRLELNDRDNVVLKWLEASGGGELPVDDPLALMRCLHHTGVDAYPFE
jgi:hypothetical protein